MNLTLIYTNASGESREETIALSAESFSVGGLYSHDLRLPNLAEFELACSISKNGINFNANRDVSLSKETVNTGEWQPSARLEVGSHCLTLISVTESSVLIDVSLFVDESYLSEINPFQTTGNGFLTKRKVAYLLMLAVIVFGLILPLGYHFFIKDGGQPEQWHGTKDTFWTSGDLVNAHQHRDIDGNCQSCHSELLVQSKDEDCTQCHQEITAHAAYNPHTNIGESEPRCASCHKEHSGQGNIINYDSAGCINCHNEPQLWSRNDNTLRPTTNFDSEGHPSFRLNMLVFDEEQWSETRVDYDPNLLEQSNLKFSHSLHMNANKVEQKGAALACNDCHALNSDGEHFAPVSMEAHCLDCHSLGIDIEDDERQLPHGQPSQVVKSLEEFMSYQYINPQLRKNRQQINVRTRSIPGKAKIRTTFDIDPCTAIDTVFECVADEVEELSKIQFEIAGCVTCHEVEQTNAESLYERWYVKPIKLQDDWYSGHQFDHQAHLVGNFGDSAGACLSCHSATLAETSNVILIPDKESCLACHVQGDETSVDMDCLSCHEFHRPEQPSIHSDESK